MKSLILAFAIATLQSHAASLDAPAEPPRPTIGSEIYRGNYAIYDCDKGTSNHLLLSQCVSRLHSLNVQGNTATEAFSLGLFFGAWVNGDIIVRNRNTPEAIRAAEMDLRLAEQYRVKLGLTFDDVCTATKMNCNILRPRWNEWSKRIVQPR